MKNLMRFSGVIVCLLSGLTHYNLIAQEQNSVIKFQKSPLNNSVILSKNESLDMNNDKTDSNYEIQRTVSFDFSGHSTGIAETQSTQTLFYGDPPGTIFSTIGGYIAGPNGYGDLGKYERFDFTGTGKLEQVDIHFFVNDIVGTPDSYTLVVKTVGSNGAPKTTIHSAVYSFNENDEDQIFTMTYFINTEVTVSGAFFIGIEWKSTNDDKFAIILDAKGKGDNKKRAWEKAQNGTYADMYSAWANGSVPFDSDLWIAAIVRSGPPTPTLSTPIDGDTNIALNTTLVWNASDGATSYQLQVSDDSSFSNTVFDQSNITVTSQQVSGLTNNTQYFWRVNATDNTGTSDWSSIWSFNTINIFTVTTSSNPSNGGTTTGAGTYESGQSVTVTATPNSGYSFVNWTEGEAVVSTDLSYTFTISDNRILTANFSEIQYTVTTSSDPSNGGSTDGAGTYTSGQSVTVIATPNIGYSFVNWTEGGTIVSTDSSYQFTISNDRTLIANFLAITGVEGSDLAKPVAYKLLQNYPNPFNPTTEIAFQLPSSSFVKIKVFNSKGIEVANLVEKQYPAGSYQTEWNATGMSSGIYYCRIQAENYSETKKMVLLR